MSASRILATLCVSATALTAAEYRATNAADLTRLTPKLQPGDTVLLASGSWKDQEVRIRAIGTEKQPVIFRAETPGKVIISGQGSVDIDGEHIVVSGLILDHGEAAQEGIAVRGSHCRVTDCAVIDSIYKFYVRLFGTHHRLDHCYLAGKPNESPTMQVECPGEPTFHEIDHNHFGPRPPLGKNGGETMRVGYSHQSMNEGRVTVEANLFERCDGELEVISNKSCDNVYRGNTFLECAGMTTLRHGNRCRVEGNFFLGNHKKGSGGIRVIGEDHVVVNNYIDGVMQGAFWVTSGIPDSPLVGYFQARNCLIAFNTVTRSQGPCIELAAGLGSSGRTLAPEGITVANNLFVLEPGEALLKGTEDRGYRWIGNVVSGAGVTERPGLRVSDVSLALTAGLLRFPASAPRILAEGSFPAVTTDIDGQPRATPLDIGCDQRSSAPVLSHPLTAAEVGPAWRNPESLPPGTPTVVKGAGDKPAPLSRQDRPQ